MQKIKKQPQGCKSGKKARSAGPTDQQIAERLAFDNVMNAKFRSIQLFSAMTLKEAMVIAGFNVRRFAHWISQRSKKVTIEGAAMLKSVFGSYGGLIPKRHLA